MPELLSDAHLGIVPVIWEDNLPQVAIELVSMGIPILASSAGGPSELSSSSYFKFKVASIEDFNKKLAYLLDNPKGFDDFWDKKKHLPTFVAGLKNINFKIGFKGLEKIALPLKLLMFRPFLKKSPKYKKTG